MEFWIAVRDGRVRCVADGCGSSRACGSMTTIPAEGNSAAAALGPEDIPGALGEWGAGEHWAVLAANTLNEACAEHWRRRDGEAGGNGS